MFQVIIQQRMKDKEVLNNVQSRGAVCSKGTRIRYQENKLAQIIIEILDGRELKERSREGGAVVKFFCGVFMQHAITIDTIQGMAFNTTHGCYCLHIVTAQLCMTVLGRGKQKYYGFSRTHIPEDVL